MKISALNSVYSGCSLNTNQGKKMSRSPQYSQGTFKGQLGQATGAGLGALAGVAASLVLGPLASLVIAGIGLAGGGFIGDKIEDKLDDISDKKNSQNGG